MELADRSAGIPHDHYPLLQRLAAAGLPTENGIGVIESWDGENQVADDYRIAYHRDHINAMKAAMFEDGRR